MLLLHIAYSEEDAAARIQFAFGHPYPAACLYIFEIHRKKSHPRKGDAGWKKHPTSNLPTQKNRIVRCGSFESVVRGD